MFCKQCGYNNDKYTRMCRRCGSDLYTAEDEQYSAPEPEKGKLPRQREEYGLIDDLKQLFSRGRRYITMSRRTKYIIAGCVAGALLLALITWGAFSCARSCNEPAPDYTSYTASGNIAHGSTAVSDGEHIYYSELFGDNPGLYRVSEASGERQKLSYRRLTGLVHLDGHLYGTDVDSGEFIRITVNGLDAQTALDFSPEHVNVIGSTFYFVKDGCIYSAAITDELPLKPVEIYSGGDARYLSISMNDAYFLRVSPELTNEVASAAGLVCGMLTHMDMLTGTLEPLHDTPADMLTMYGEYLFFAVPATATFETIIEPDEGEEDEDDMEDGEDGAAETYTETVACAEFRRLNTITGETVIFLSPGIGYSPLNVTAQGVYFIGSSGGIERVPFGGGEPERIPAFETDISNVVVLGDSLYFRSSGGRRFCSINTDGSGFELLCEVRDYQLAEPDVSASDAAQ